MNARFKAQIESIDPSEAKAIDRLLLFWAANNSELGNDAEMTNNFIAALLNAGLPLYYMDDNFDSERAFVDYRLSLRCIDRVTNEIENSIAVSQYEDTLISSDHSTLNNCMDSSWWSHKHSPFWSGSRVSIELEKSLADEVSGVPVQVNMESLCVKCLDVKRICQLIGVQNFYWPYTFPNQFEKGYYEYRRSNGRWYTHEVSDAAESNVGITKSKKSVHEPRMECLKFFIEKYYRMSNQRIDAVKNKKLPPPRRVYSLIKNEPVFSNYAGIGRAPILYSTFKHAWTTQYKIPLIRHFFE